MAVAILPLFIVLRQIDLLSNPLGVALPQAAFELPIGVNNISSQFATDYSVVLAYTTLSMIPALVFYALAERQIVSGLTDGTESAGHITIAGDAAVPTDRVTANHVTIDTDPRNETSTAS